LAIAFWRMVPALILLPFDACQRESLGHSILHQKRLHRNTFPYKHIFISFEVEA
jgi:hypothetical protein